MRVSLLLLVLWLLICSPVAAFDPGFSEIVYRVNGLDVPYSVFSYRVLPGDSLRIELRTSEKDYNLRATDGIVRSQTYPNFIWIAPQTPGLVELRIVGENDSTVAMLNTWVMVPLDRKQGEKLNGYRIGNYPSVPLKGLSIYEKPKGLIEVTDSNRNTPVSPHFTLGQFLCKQESGYPKYIIVQEKLLLKLELILQKLNEKGYAYDSITIMSGYRTPYYNHAIGNVKYSRHVWGGAADIFLDESPRDDMMDDLNRDGVHDWRDAAVLYNLVDNLYGQPFYQHLVGGLGRYKKTSNHGPFVHVDVRGFRARWGT
ncbi:hypothetical protein KQI52_14870 [bacterium]|nr:hypothetical protein [bacterium]